jgi:hypothetical protein
MATGDQTDFVSRLKAVLPTQWFPDTAPDAASSTPVLDAVVASLAWGWAQIYALLAYVKMQTRINTATDVWLDLIAQDFFGSTLQRAAGQSDASYRAFIKAKMFRHVGTRDAITNAVALASGPGPSAVIVEPWNTRDCGAWGRRFAWSGPGATGAGVWGSLTMPATIFVTVNDDFGSGAAAAAVVATKAEGVTAWIQTI